MVLKGDAYVVTPDGQLKRVDYVLKAIGWTSGRLYIMTLSPSGTPKYDVNRFKEEVMDVSDKLLESAVRDFVNVAYRMGIKSFYVESGDGELFEVTIKD